VVITHKTHVNNYCTACMRLSDVHVSYLIKLKEAASLSSYYCSFL